MISTQVSISGKAIKRGRIWKPLSLHRDSCFLSACLVFWGPLGKAVLGMPCPGPLGRGGGGRGMCGSWLSSPQKHCGFLLEQVRKHSGAPADVCCIWNEGAQRGNTGPERSGCLELWDHPRGTQTKSISHSCHGLNGDLNFKLLKANI